MSSNNTSEYHWCRKEHHSHCNWHPANIAGVVIGFMLFGPFGLLILMWVLSGRDVRAIPRAAKEQYQKFTGSSRKSIDNSDNVVFNDYQQTQYDRIHEIKEEIKSRAQDFANFRSSAKRRADQAEFDDFMSSKPSK